MLSKYIIDVFIMILLMTSWTYTRNYSSTRFI